MKTFDYQDHKIILGDSLEILSCEISDHSVDLIFVDPPYNIGKNFNGHKDKWATEEEYLNWCYEWIDLCINKLKSNGSMYIMTSTQFMPYFDIFIRKRMAILSRLIWYYDSSGVQAKNYYGSMYEPILFCVKNPNDYTFNSQDILVEAKTGAKRKLIDYRKNPPQVYNLEKVPGNVWEFSRVRYRMDEYENHPTQKPIALLKRIIAASSNKGDTILDPFSGTFTTSFVAKQLGRKSIGIELQEDYVKIGLRRLQLTNEYNGEKLQKEIRTFETKKARTQNPSLLNLFGKQSDETFIH
ncbi:MAG: adenine-specific DNA-methyltransferase [Planctomycetaceae bacterium]|jgi:site-specific DNA-methyltransferase (adenine-specific)|nr:adenine-specific DNA-methyltransferase [Planctomycetaceae bacterium]